MPDVTLESLAARVAALEARLSVPPAAGVLPASRPLESVFGMTEETEFTRLMIAEMEAAREADRRAAREGGGE